MIRIICLTFSVLITFGSNASNINPATTTDTQVYLSVLTTDQSRPITWLSTDIIKSHPLPRSLLFPINQAERHKHANENYFEYKTNFIFPIEKKSPNKHDLFLAGNDLSTNIYRQIPITPETLRNNVSHQAALLSDGFISASMQFKNLSNDPITPVPEPVAFLLIALGLFLVWLSDQKNGKNKK